MLSVGLVGLPNVGKSTLFNALTAGHANVSNYPFTTIDSNVGQVPVPDPRLEELARILAPEETTPCAVEFIDIAGLVEGASRGEGLGNRFLGEIRQVDLVAHVLRCFAEVDVAHVFAEVDPARDAAVVETELLLADLEVLGRAIEKRERIWKTSPKESAAPRERLGSWREALEAGRPLRSLGLDPEGRAESRTMGLLTGVPIVYVANVSEEDLGAASESEGLAEKIAAATGAPAEVVPISARIEWELAQLEPAERREMAAALGIERSGLERLVETCFARLSLVRFYTAVHGKLRAWEVERGTPAPAAAGKIHGDMERGFIRARVVSFEDLRAAGSLDEAHRAGRLRTEGKAYEIRDGDVVEFLFNP